MNTIDNLPDELIAQIISEIPLRKRFSTARISKRWKKIFQTKFECKISTIVPKNVFNGTFHKIKVLPVIYQENIFRSTIDNSYLLTYFSSKEEIRVMDGWTNTVVFAIKDLPSELLREGCCAKMISEEVLLICKKGIAFYLYNIRKNVCIVKGTAEFGFAFFHPLDLKHAIIVIDGDVLLIDIQPTESRNDSEYDFIMDDGNRIVKELYSFNLNFRFRVDGEIIEGKAGTIFVLLTDFIVTYFKLDSLTLTKIWTINTEKNCKAECINLDGPEALLCTYEFDKIFIYRERYTDPVYKLIIPEDEYPEKLMIIYDGEIFTLVTVCNITNVHLYKLPNDIFSKEPTGTELKDITNTYLSNAPRHTKCYAACSRFLLHFSYSASRCILSVYDPWSNCLLYSTVISSESDDYQWYSNRITYNSFSIVEEPRFNSCLGIKIGDHITTVIDFSRSTYKTGSLVTAKSPIDGIYWPAVVVTEYPITNENEVELILHESKWRLRASRLHGYMVEGAHLSLFKPFLHKEFTQAVNISDKMYSAQLKYQIVRKTNPGFPIEWVERAIQNYSSPESIYIYLEYGSRFSQKVARSTVADICESNQYDNSQFAFSNKMPAYIHNDKAQGHYIVFDSTYYVYSDTAYGDFAFLLIQQISGLTNYTSLKDTWPNCQLNNPCTSIRSLTLYNALLAPPILDILRTYLPNLSILRFWECHCNSETIDIKKDLLPAKLETLDIQYVESFDILEWINSSHLDLLHLTAFITTEYIHQHLINILDSNTRLTSIRLQIPSANYIDTLNAIFSSKYCNSYSRIRLDIYYEDGPHHLEEIEIEIPLEEEGPIVIFNDYPVVPLLLKGNAEDTKDSLDNIDFLSNNEEQHIETQPKEVVTEKEKTNQYLSYQPLPNLHYFHTNSTIDNNFIKQLITHAPNLRTFIISSLHTSTWDGVSRLNQFIYLQTLAIPGGYFMGLPLNLFIEIFKIFVTCPSLEHLSLTAINRFRDFDNIFQDLGQTIIDVFREGFKKLKSITVHVNENEYISHERSIPLVIKDETEKLKQQKIDLVSNVFISALAVLPKLECISLRLSQHYLTKLSTSLKALCKFAVQNESGKYTHPYGISLRKLRIAAKPTDVKCDDMVFSWGLSHIYPQTRFVIEYSKTK